MATVTETPEEALARIQSMGFGKNDALCIMAFAERGIDPEQITPRENVLTFRAWRAKGRQVAKGAISVQVTTWIPCKDSKRQTKEGEERAEKLRPKTAYLFHVSQTIPVGSEKGTRPDAWANPLLVREGTYEDDSQPIAHVSRDVADAFGIQESSQTVINEAECTFRRDELHEQREAFAESFNDWKEGAANWAHFNPAEATELANLESTLCTCPMAGVVTNVDCPIHGKAVA